MFKDLALEFVKLIAALVIGTIVASQLHGQDLTPAEAQALAEEAYIAGYPIVENFRALVAQLIHQDDDAWQAPLNTIWHEAVWFEAGAAAVDTPNPDVLKSGAWLDIRAEPLVLGVPEIEPERYFSIQFTDLYNYNFAFVGTRTTGHGGGNWLLAGPDWDGPPPAGIDAVIRCETLFVAASFLTQLFSPDDFKAAVRIQEQFSLQPLSSFLGQSPPENTAIDDVPFEWLTDSDLGFFSVLNAALPFCPPIDPEARWRAAAARIGVAAGQAFDPAVFDPEIQEALRVGVEAGDAVIAKAMQSAAASVIFGARDEQQAQTDPLRRAVGARLKLQGNSREERLNSLYRSDAAGEPLDASKTGYVLRFDRNQLPPVDAFWSITAYDALTRNLIDNPLNRTSINSTMLPDLATGSDGSVEILIQQTSPADQTAVNWLPAPAGPFYLVLRLYCPKPEAWDGTWTAPLASPAASLVDEALAIGAEVTQEVKPSVLTEQPKPELERPTVWGEPTEVRVLIYMIDVDDVDSADQSFAASVYYVASWNNPLLRHAGPGPVLRGLSDVWNPRLTILGQQMSWRSYPESVEIQPNGTVIYRQKLWGRFSQPLNLRDFPLDQQDLSIHIVTAGLLEDDVKIIPLSDPQTGRASAISEQFSLPDFDVVSWEARPTPYFPVRNEPGVAGYELKIRVQRQLTYYMLKVIIPLCLIVIMSWLPRWIDPEQGGTNIGISTTAFLTLIAYLFAITVFLPRVSYVTRMDRFILLSTLMVFAGLLQTVANTSLMKQQKRWLVERLDRWSRYTYPLVLAAILVLSFVV